MQQALLTNELDRFEVIHPLYDAPEAKCDASTLGPMNLSKSVRFSLLLLRGYLVLMGIMLGYHLLDLAGVFAKHGQ